MLPGRLPPLDSADDHSLFLHLHLHLYLHRCVADGLCLLSCCVGVLRRVDSHHDPIFRLPPFGGVGTADVPCVACAVGCAALPLERARCRCLRYAWAGCWMCFVAGDSVEADLP